MPRSFSPFKDRVLANLIVTDLAALREVHEGWYVEYKQELPGTKEIAKSIAAFANTYGGWLFFGVREESKNNNVAGSFPGIPTANVEVAIQKIRQSATEHLNPSPFFNLKMLHGPCEEVGLRDGMSVLCLHVPQGNSGPHVHSNGVIYRRVADSSEPRPESDRHQLELLWERHNKINDEYEHWIDSDPEVSKKEEDSPYLRLLLTVDPSVAALHRSYLSHSEIAAILNDTTSGVMVPLEAVYPSSIGIVARQTSSLLRHENLGLTWIIGHDLKVEIIIPINVFSYTEPSHVETFLYPYDNTANFIDLLVSHKSCDSKILDLNNLFMVLAAVFNMYARLMKRLAPDVDTCGAKLILKNVWRCIPFLDSPSLIERVQRYGLPLCLTSDCIVPTGTTTDSFAQIRLPREEGERDAIVYAGAFIVLDLLCNAVGVPGVLSEDDRESSMILIEELLEAHHRGLKRQAT